MAKFRSRVPIDAGRLTGLRVISGNTFEIGSQNGPDTQRFGNARDIRWPCLAGAYAEAKCFECHVETNGAAIAKAIDDGLGGREHTNLDAIDHNHLDAGRQRGSTEIDKANRAMRDAGFAILDPDGHPDGPRVLQRDAVERERRDQANDPLGNAHGHFGQAVVERDVRVGELVEAASGAHDEAFIDQACKRSCVHAGGVEVGEPHDAPLAEQGDSAIALSWHVLNCRSYDARTDSLYHNQESKGSNFEGAPRTAMRRSLIP